MEDKMKSKYNFNITLLILIILIGPFGVSGSPPSSDNGGQNGDTQSILPTAHPFYDAQVLYDFEVADSEMKGQKILAVLKVLIKYSKNCNFINLVGSKNDLDMPFLNDMLTKDYLKEFEGDNNPFLNGYIQILRKTIIEKMKKLEDELANFKKGKNLTESEALEDFKKTDTFKSWAPQEEVSVAGEPAAAATGFLSPTVVVDALARLIAKRFKEELTIRYLEEFRDKLQGSDLKELFPSTTVFLLSSEIFNFKVFLPTLKEAFQNDLNNLDSNLYKYLKNCKNKIETELNDKIAQTSDQEGKKDLERKQKILNVVLLLWDIVVEVKAGKHPGGIIGNLNNLEYIEDFDDKGTDSIRFVVLMTRTLSRKEGDGWIEWKELNDIIDPQKKDLRDLFVGLLYASVMKDFKNEDLKKTLKAKGDKLEKILGYIDRAIKLADRIQEQIDELKKKKEEAKEITFEQYHFYLYTVFELFELGTDIVTWAGKVEDVEYIQLYLGYARDLLEISRNIYDKAYGVAILNTIELLNKAAVKDSAIVKKIVKYLSFMNSIAAARDAEEMQKVLEAAALPVGSYRIKRASIFNISLNAYPGGFMGFDYLTAGEEIKGSRWGDNLAFAAPVGLAFSWGNPKKGYDKPGPSNSLFISIIDIGAVVSWRISDENTGGLPEFKWKNILAPGLFYMHGIENSPLTIGAGIQYGPQLREIKSPTEAEIVESGSLRIGIIVAVDIPIFNIHTKMTKE
jgi:hypothetical protein